MPDVIKGKYRIVREIARSNDIVYEAVDTTFGRKIALKELNIAAGVSGQARRERIERFNREARAAGRLSHPNIVSVFDFGEENGRYFIAMEYLEGQSLRDAMQVRGAYPLGEALAIVYQVLDALSYAHANRVVHRDIKPDNIHILPGGQAKITDFGIARLDEEPALTGDGQVFGTPSYMSPEQIEGKGIDFRTDLFSAGILLYEMLSGRKPFTGDSVISITYAIMQAEPGPLQGVPQGIEQVIRRALSKQPQMRQISADQMKMDLKAAEQTPAMFFPPMGQTNLGGHLGGATGYGYVGQGSQSGYGSAQGGGGGYTTGASPGMQGGYPGGMSGYSPPGNVNQQSQPGGNGGLPWSWNSPGQGAQPQQQMPSVYTAQQSHQPPQQPGFSGLPNPYGSPPFPKANNGPLIVLSPGAKTALNSVLLAIVIGTVLALGIIAVQHSYDNFQETAHVSGVNKLMNEAESAYNNKDYVSAIKKFNLAQQTNPTPAQRHKISTELAYSWVCLSQLARAAGKLSEAMTDCENALAAAPDNSNAHEEFAVVLQLKGDTSGAQEHRAAAAESSGKSSGQSPPAKLDLSTPPPSASTSSEPDHSLEDRRKEARQLINEGDDLNRNGDLEGARDKWTQAVGKAAGTPESSEANNRLYPKTGSDTGSDGSGF